MSTKKCLTCIPTNKKVSKTTKKRATWKAERGMTTIFPDDKVPMLKGLQTSSPIRANQSVEVKLGKKNANRMVLYYASGNTPLNKCNNCEVKGANEAYANFKNGGIAKLDSDGNGVLKIKCPQVYHEEKKTYESHVHFILSNNTRTKWVNKLLTQTVVCELDYQDMKKIVDSKCALIINALPFEYYVRNRIPESIPLDHNLVPDKLNKKHIVKYINSMLHHCPKIEKSVVKGKIDLMDIPIVVYCYDTGCEADTDLQQKLNKIGFTNIKIYSGGIIDWRKHSRK
jgi:rhodanese-related sulfurtransferase